MKGSANIIMLNMRCSPCFYFPIQASMVGMHYGAFLLPILLTFSLNLATLVRELKLLMNCSGLFSCSYDFYHAMHGVNCNCIDSVPSMSKSFL